MNNFESSPNDELHDISMALGMVALLSGCGGQMKESPEECQANASEYSGYMLQLDGANIAIDSKTGDTCFLVTTSIIDETNTLDNGSSIYMTCVVEDDGVLSFSESDLYGFQYCREEPLSVSDEIRMRCYKVIDGTCDSYMPFVTDTTSGSELIIYIGDSGQVVYEVN